MTLKIIHRLRNDEAFKKTYEDFIDLLTAYGVFEVLSARGVPDFINLGTNPHATAAQGAKSYGYFSCLNDIKNFKETFLSAPPPQVNPSALADFGGKEAAIQKGYLSKEEIDGIKPK